MNWRQSDVGPTLFDYYPRDLICTLNSVCSPGGPGGPMGDASIVGRKFLDIDRDGLFGLDDPPLNDFEVRLFDATGTHVATTVTKDVDLDDSGGIDPATERGVYLFENVPAQSYVVRERAPLAFARTTQDATTLIEVSKTAQGLVAADLEGDGDNDLILNRSGTAFGSNRGLSVLTNDGNGVFTIDDLGFGSSSVDAQSNPAVADLNLDQRLDIGVGTGVGYNILLQSESGGFNTGPSARLDDFVSILSATDVNGDNAPDLIGLLSGDDQVFVALNLGLDGDNMWQGMSDLAILDATDLESIHVGDVDGDTFPDIVTGLGTVFKNDGLGNFAPSMDPGLESMSASANDTELLDIDGDGDLDAVYVNGGFKLTPDFTVAIAKNDGMGNFTPTQSFFSVRPGGATPIDLEDDSDLDLAIRINVNGDDVDADFIQFLMNDGSGFFTLATGPFVTGEDRLTGMVAADIDGQPGDELAITIGFTGSGNPDFVAILDNPLGNVGVDALSNQRVLGPDFGNALSAAVVEGQKFEDLNFNGVQDPGEHGLNGVEIEVRAARFSMARKAQVVTADEDLNGDNVIDPETERGRFRLIYEPGSENVILESIPEGFLQTFPNAPRPADIQSFHIAFEPGGLGFREEGDYTTTAWTVVDINGDTHPDVLYGGEFDPDPTGRPDRNLVQVFLNDGTGLFNDPDDMDLPDVAIIAQEFAFDAEVLGIAAADFDGGGTVDFATLEDGTETIRLFQGDGAGGFTESGSVLRGRSLGDGSLHAVDIDNDTDFDLVAVNQAAVTVMVNDGAGAFALQGTFFSENLFGFPQDAIVADLNNDSFADLATTHRGIDEEDGLFVILNRGLDGGNAWLGFADGANVPFDLGTFDFGPVAFGNIDADADVELVSANASDDLVILDNDGSGGFSVLGTVPTGLSTVNDLGLVDQNKDGALDVAVVGNEPSFSDFRDGNIFRGDGLGGFTPLDVGFPLLAERADVADFDGDGDPEIGFHSDVSQRIGFFDFLQPQHEVAVDVGETTTEINFGNFPVTGR